MNAKTALIKALLEGRVLSVHNCAKTIGLTNIAREIPRMVEDEFKVEVSRTHKTGKNVYGSSISWTDYRLNKTEYNKDGIKKMREYLADNWETPKPETLPGYVQTRLL